MELIKWLFLLFFFFGKYIIDEDEDRFGMKFQNISSYAREVFAWLKFLK